MICMKIFVNKQPPKNVLSTTQNSNGITKLKMSFSNPGKSCRSCSGK